MISSFPQGDAHFHGFSTSRDFSVDETSAIELPSICTFRRLNRRWKRTTWRIFTDTSSSIFISDLQLSLKITTAMKDVFRINPQIRKRIYQNGFLSFLIDNPHSAINSHHTVSHGNFHNFRFSFLDCFLHSKAWSCRFSYQMKFSSTRKLFRFFFTLVHFRFRAVISYNKLDFRQFNFMANTVYWLEIFDCCKFEWFSFLFRFYSQNESRRLILNRKSLENSSCSFRS